MIVFSGRTGVNGMDKFHDYLYELEEDNFTLLEMYDEIVVDFSELEDELDCELEEGETFKDKFEDKCNENDMLMEEIKSLIKDFKILKKAEVLEELKIIIT